MATSGSVDYSDTRNTLIQDALINLGVYGTEQTLRQADLNFAARALNRMLKAWDAQGIHLWTRARATIFLAVDTFKYSLDNQSTAARWADDSGVSETTLSAAEASGQTVISVTSSAGMTAADIVGIVLDDLTTHWTTIVSVDSATQITITVATTGAAASGNRVYSFTSRANRPIKIDQILLRTGDDTDTVLMPISRDQYLSLPNKESSSSTPSQWYYDPQLTTGALYIYPPPSDTSERLKISYQRQIQDFDAAGDTPDLPQEWYEAIVFNLSVRLAPAYRKFDKLPLLKPLADEYLQLALSFDQETDSITILPGLR